MKIDLVSSPVGIQWKQDACLWDETLNIGNVVTCLWLKFVFADVIFHPSIQY
jgi:hypothetical protein